MPRSGYWNHNVHYQPVILNAVPPGCRTALDIGCGDGLLAARLDFVCANTSLHHMDFTAALTTMARLLRPGGRLAVIGLAADKSLGDVLKGVPGVPADLFYRAIYHRGESAAPIMDPDHSWREVRAAARETLPGVRYRRHLLWRYSLLWRKPSRATS